MAVETRYVVVRNNEDVMTFTDKKAADEYDKMLDMADAVTDLILASDLQIEDQVAEELAVYLAKNREPLLYALQAKKPPAKKKPAQEPAKDKASATDKDAD